MFEKLPFLHMELSEQPMDQSHPQFWEELQQFQEERKIYFDTAAVRAEYRNVGHLSLLPTPPISAFARSMLREATAAISMCSAFLRSVITRRTILPGPGDAQSYSVH